jgi:hypothetical protein
MPVRTAQEFEEILPLSQRELLGLEAGHVAALESDCCVPGARMLLHPAATRALRALCDDARGAGFELRAVSGFRAFQRQLQIWNGKARGERELLDADERPLRAGELEPVRLVEAILCWSALPGLSRHHWGSDVDVIDMAAIKPGDVPRLFATDCRGEGCQASLHAWLDARICKGEAHGFFRPFTGKGCDVAAEPWHLSFAPLSARCQASLDESRLRAALDGVDLELRAVVYAQLGRILERYAWIPAAAYPEPWGIVVEQADRG